MFNLSLFETIALTPSFDSLCERRGDAFCEVSLLFVCACVCVSMYERVHATPRTFYS